MNPIPLYFVRKFIAYARRYVPPRLSSKAATVLQQTFLELRLASEGHPRSTDSIPITTRQLESLIRLSQARVRPELAETVSAEHAQAVVDIMQECPLDTYVTDDGNLDFGRSGGMSLAKKVKAYVARLMKAAARRNKHKLYANIKKCTIGAPEIPVLGCFDGKNGVRPDPEKIRVIVEWPTPNNVKELRKFLGLATYLHKYSCNYAGLIRPLSKLLKKDVEWHWNTQCQDAFDAVKRSLTEAPVLAIADNERPFHVVCHASDFAIGCALMQRDRDDRDRVIFYQSRQLRPAERNYDKKLPAMKYALAKFQIYLLGDRPFVVCTDHASLRTAVNSPHISQRMARWLSFFAEYNFTVEYKPGYLNVIADALSRRPD